MTEQETHRIPNGEGITQRDRVFAAVLESTRFGRTFRLKSVRHEFPIDDRPSDETIRRVLRSLTQLGVVEHTDGSPYYRLSDEYC